MKSSNMFTTTKGNLETALRNYEVFLKENEKMVTLYLDQLKQENNKLHIYYKEWVENSNKAFDDYRDMIIKGLDYLSNYMENGHQAPGASATKPEKSIQNLNNEIPEDATLKTVKSNKKIKADTPAAA